MEMIERKKCIICGSHFESDLLWEKEFRTRIKYEFFNEEFFQLCPRHKFVLLGNILIMLYIKRELNERDLIKMDILKYFEHAQKI